MRAGVLLQNNQGRGEEMDKKDHGLINLETRWWVNGVSFAFIHVWNNNEQFSFFFKLDFR